VGPPAGAQDAPPSPRGRRTGFPSRASSSGRTPTHPRPGLGPAALWPTLERRLVAGPGRGSIMRGAPARPAAPAASHARGVARDDRGGGDVARDDGPDDGVLAGGDAGEDRRVGADAGVRAEESGVDLPGSSARRPSRGGRSIGRPSAGFSIGSSSPTGRGRRFRGSPTSRGLPARTVGSRCGWSPTRGTQAGVLPRALRLERWEER